MSASTREIPIVLLHSNDIHGDFTETEVDGLRTGGLARLSGYVHRTRRQEPHVVYAIAGDMFMGSVIDQEYRGLSTIKLTNVLEPDVFAVGNHEIDYGLSHLLFLEKCADFPIVCGNLYIKELNRRLFSASADVLRGGVRIRFIGLLTESVADHIRQEELVDSAVSVRSAAGELRKIFAELRETPADITVLLDHLGIEEDKLLAARLDPDWGVDLIIGGHSHTFMEQPLIVNGIPIAQAGFGSDQIGRFDLVWDTEAQVLKRWSWRLVPVNEETSEVDPLADLYLERFQTETERKYDQVLLSLPCRYVHNGFHRETPLLDLFADLYREVFRADVFWLSSNMLRVKELGPEVTRRDLMIALPYDNEIYALTVDGSRLAEIIRHVYRKEAWEGTNVFLLCSGSLRLRIRRPDKEVLAMRLAGEEIRAERSYVVGITTYIYKNMELFLGVRPGEAGVAVRRLHSNDREALEEFFAMHQSFALRNEGRLELVEL